MALIDEVKNEIMERSKAPKAEPAKTARKPRQKPKSKEEIAAYIAKKQAEEERRYLRQQEGSPAPKRGRKPKAATSDKEVASQKVVENKPKRQRRQQVMKETYVSKPRPKTVQTIDLPDGGSLLVVYMPGPS